MGVVTPLFLAFYSTPYGRPQNGRLCTKSDKERRRSGMDVATAQGSPGRPREPREAPREAPGGHRCKGETDPGRRPGKRLEATVVRGKPIQEGHFEPVFVRFRHYSTRFGGALTELCRKRAGSLTTVSGIREIDLPTWSVKTQNLKTVSGNKQIWSSNTRVGGEGY